MTEEQMAEALRPSAGDWGRFYLPALGSAMAALAIANPARPSHEAFLALCDAVFLGFPGDELPTDEEISANPMTPHLMRYFVHALRAYRDQVGGEHNDDVPQTHARRAALAKAFGLNGEVKRARAWSEHQQIAIYHAYTVGAEGEADASPQQRCDQGFLAAFQFAFGAIPERGKDDSTLRRNASRLHGLLREHGYPDSKEHCYSLALKLT